jgi:hypothetical protein
MPTVADYVVMLDKSAVLDPNGTNHARHKFNLPANLMTSHRAIIMCAFTTDDVDDLEWELRLNLETLAKFKHNGFNHATIHEIFPGSVLKNAEENSFMAIATKGDGTVRVSDIVLFFQVEV